MLATVMGYINEQQTTCNCTQSWTYGIVWLTTPRRNKNTQIANRAHTSDSLLPHERGNPPQCTCCQTVLTIEHLLLHCNNYTSIRNKYYDTTTLSELFSKISPHKILEFLKECDLYHKI